MVGGRGELAERERLPRDGQPQRRVVGGRSLVRVARCIDRLSKMSESRDQETDRNRTGSLSVSPPPPGLGAAEAAGAAAAGAEE